MQWHFTLFFICFDSSQLEACLFLQLGKQKELMFFPITDAARQCASCPSPSPRNRSCLRRQNPRVSSAFVCQVVVPGEYKCKKIDVIDHRFNNQTSGGIVFLIAIIHRGCSISKFFSVV